MTEAIVTSDPDVLGGVPCFAGTRMPVRTILRFVLDGWSNAAIRREFPDLSPEHLLAAREMCPEDTP